MSVNYSISQGSKDPQIPSAQITYVDSDWLRVLHTTMVIRVDRILKVRPSLAHYCEEFNISGYTNGRLFIIYDKDQGAPYHHSLFQTALIPLGLMYHEDMNMVKELKPFGRDNTPNKFLYRDLPDTMYSPWLGSELNEDGSFIWMRLLPITELSPFEIYNNPEYTKNYPHR